MILRSMRLMNISMVMMNSMMSYTQVIEFKEQEHFSFTYFQNKFNHLEGISAEYVNDILKTLELSHCLKHYIPARDNLDDIDIENYSAISNEYYKFTFVGIVKVKSIIFLIYPKYWKNIENEANKLQKFTQILYVIDKYKKSTNILNIGATEEYGLNRIPNLIVILQDYLSNGLYSNEEALIEMNGEEQILWDKTINESFSYLADEIPVYLDMYTQMTALNEMDIIRKLHASIITEIYIEIIDILSYIGLDFDFNLTDEAIDDIGSTEYILYLLDRELSKQYITNKQIILHNMKLYIENRNHQVNESIQLYGTTSFNLVWESVCATVYQSSLNMDMKSLKLQGKDQFYDIDLKDLQKEQLWNKLKLSGYVEKPIWSQGLKKAKATKSLVLDVLEVDMDAKVFRIFDAKYYQIKFNKDERGDLKILGQPGVGDITKQYLYQLAYRKLAELNGYGFSNGFIIPKDDLEEEELPNNLGVGKLLGEVKMNMLSELKLMDILVIGRDCVTIFNQYLQL